MTDNREILVPVARLRAIEDVLRESTVKLQQMLSDIDDDDGVVNAAIAEHVASDREVIEAIKIVREP